MRPGHSQPPAGEVSLAEAVAVCLAGGAFMEGIKAIYATLDRDVELLGALCAGCGECCKFDLTGRLPYVTTGELALLSTAATPAGAELHPLRCPYQLGPRCTARALRPLGCRAFFCRREIKDRTEALYERYHARLRRLHERHSAPYAYVELTNAIVELSARSTGAAKTRTKALT
jgi:Fe-S-cluster containining protein